jgi:hypothetical protein
MCLTPTRAIGNPLPVELLEAGDRSIISEDVDGRFRFAPALHNAARLGALLASLAIPKSPPRASTVSVTRLR